MRGVGFFISLLAVVLAGRMAAAAPEDPAVASETAAKQSSDDYYSRRARTVLEAEKAAAQKPHPLAQSYPGMDVVVCQAGCVRPAPEVVYLRPEPSAQSGEREAVMITTAGNDHAVAASSSSPDAIACIAGCYENAYDAPIRPAEPPVVSVAPALPPLSATVPPRDKLSPIR